jgi:hypothetical protein
MMKRAVEGKMWLDVGVDEVAGLTTARDLRRRIDA